MALGFGRRGDANQSGVDLNTPPLDYVLQMRQQGLSNNQIIQSLQRMGFNSDKIFEALNQADVKGNMSQQAPPEMMSQMPDPSNPAMGPPSPNDMYAQPDMPPPMMQEGGYDTERTEEVIESIIEEKWEDFSKSINKMTEWKNKTESKLTVIEQQLKDLKEDFDKLHQALLGKVEEYDQNILNVGTEIKAMEKVFQKVLPTLTENVNELARITNKVKNTPTKQVPKKK